MSTGLLAANMQEDAVSHSLSLRLLLRRIITLRW